MNIIANHTVAPQINRESVDFAFMGRFAITVVLGETEDMSNYEYRRYIKGNCKLQRGSFRDCQSRVKTIPYF